MLNPSNNLGKNKADKTPGSTDLNSLSCAGCRAQDILGSSLAPNREFDSPDGSHFLKTKHGACRCAEGSRANTLGNACRLLPSNRPHFSSVARQSAPSCVNRVPDAAAVTLCLGGTRFNLTSPPTRALTKDRTPTRAQFFLNTSLKAKAIRASVGTAGTATHLTPLRDSVN